MTPAESRPGPVGNRRDHLGKRKSPGNPGAFLRSAGQEIRNSPPESTSDTCESSRSLFGRGGGVSDRGVPSTVAKSRCPRRDDPRKHRHTHPVRLGSPNIKLTCPARSVSYESPEGCTRAGSGAAMGSAFSSELEHAPSLRDDVGLKLCTVRRAVFPHWLAQPDKAFRSGLASGSSVTSHQIRRTPPCKATPPQRRLAGRIPGDDSQSLSVRRDRDAQLRHASLKSGPTSHHLDSAKVMAPSDSEYPTARPEWAASTAISVVSLPEGDTTQQQSATPPVSPPCRTSDYFDQRSVPVLAGFAR